MKEGELLLKVVSPTGCVHLVKDGIVRAYRTECNHGDTWGGHHHKWKVTEKPVTCKNCLKTLKGPKPETELRTITISGSDGFGEKSKTGLIMSELKEDGCTVNDIISITSSNHSGSYNDYTVWYKKGTK